jgi:Uncharacterized protein conserved in bacteria (DUF2066)
MPCRAQSKPSAGPRPYGLLAALVAAALLTAGAGTGEAGDKVYTVANYPVEAAAENAVVAKRKALADGQEAAFRSLLKRLMPVMAYPRAKQFASVKAVELIEGVKVRAERNSATEYSAVYDFYFRPKSVRDLLRREGIPFIDDQAPPVTLVPLWQSAERSTSGSLAAWFNTWKGLDLENSLTPIKIEPLKGEVQPATIAGAVGGDAGAMRTLAGQYKTELALLAVAEHDQKSGRLMVTLAGRDAVGAFILTRQYRVDAGDPGYARELAAIVALRTLEGRWKSLHTRVETTKSGPGDTDLLISVEFRGMAEWQSISRKLSATQGVEELDVAGLSARSARVTLRYAGGAERLAQELAEQGLTLRSVGGNWHLSLR